MERRAKVELFEEIRREYEFGIGTIRGVAHKPGIHRRMVRQALASAEPPARKQVEHERPVIHPLSPLLTRSWKPIAPRRASSGTPRIGSINGLEASYLTTRWPRSRCDSMCANVSRNWAGRPARPAYRRVTRRAGKARSIGTRPGRN